LIIFNILPC